MYANVDCAGLQVVYRRSFRRDIFSASPDTHTLYLVTQTTLWPHNDVNPYQLGAIADPSKRSAISSVRTSRLSYYSDLPIPDLNAGKHNVAFDFHTILNAQVPPKVTDYTGYRRTYLPV